MSGSFSSDALLFSLLAAVFHASWNLLLKGAKERLLMIWWAMACCALGCSVGLFWQAAVPPQVWPIIALSAILQAAYFVALAWAYRLGDFSLIYPVARGLNPAFLFVWGLVFLAEKPSGWAYLALVLILAGLAIVGGGRQILRGQHGSVPWKALSAAGLVSVCSSACSAVDAYGVRNAPPMAYLVLVLGMTAICTAPVLLAMYGPQALLAEAKSSWRRILATACVMALSYGLTLAAFAIANVGYVGAVREVSVVFAVLGGKFFLQERLEMERLRGAILIFLGILMLGLLG